MSAKPDRLGREGARRVRKLPIPVAVTFARAAGTCATLEGPVRYEAGDAVLTGVSGEQWPVARAPFLAAYAADDGQAPGTDGRYVKVCGHAVAVRLSEAYELPAGPLGDPIRGKAGDWLLHHEDGSVGIVADHIFARSYEQY